MAYVSFNKSTTRLNAKTNGIAGKLYFTNDSPTIVLDGKEYGITAEQLSALQNMSSLVTAALEAAENAQAYMYSILGTLDNITEGTITSSEGQALEALISTKADAADLNDKVDKPSSANKNNIAIFNNSRNIIDSGVQASALAKKLNVDDSPVDIYCDTLIDSTDIFIDTEKTISVEAGRGLKVNINTDEYPACILDTNNNILALSVNHLVLWVNNTNNTVAVKPGIIGYTDFGSMNTYTLGTNDAIRNLKSLIDKRYEKPSLGIPIGDLSLGVTTSLSKADSALQEAYQVVSIGNQQDFTLSSLGWPVGTYNISDSSLYNTLNTIWNALKIPVLSFSLASHTAGYTIPLYKDDNNTFKGHERAENGEYTIDVIIENNNLKIFTKIIGIGNYNKPSNGIPSSDLTTTVQTSLGKADTALLTSYEIIDLEVQSGYYGTYPTGLYNLYLLDFDIYGAVNNAWNAKKIPVLTAYLSSHSKYIAIPLYREGVYPNYSYRGEADVEGLYSACANIRASSSDIITYQVYKKTNAGIQKSDLSSTVLTSLDKADTALQSNAISNMITIGDTIGYVIIGNLES